jgi:hypothetical protein
MEVSEYILSKPSIDTVEMLCDNLVRNMDNIG